MEFLIEIPANKIETAAQALTEAGIYFNPRHQLAMINPDADIDYACTAPDFGDIVSSLNDRLLRDDSGLQLPTDEDDYPLAELHSLLSLAHGMIFWSKKRLDDDSRITENGGLLAVMRHDYPPLFALLR